MYVAHFGLNEYPFGDVSSPDELFESEQLKEVVAHFFYALENHEPFFLLTGEVGTGKSTAVQAILAQLPPDTPRALVSHTSLSSRELLVQIALKFGLPEREGISKRRLLSRLEEFFAGHSREGRRPVLILDEAHLLADSFFEELRLLSNQQREGRPVLQVCLVGQPELSQRLRQDHLRQLRQRISVRYELKVFSRTETGEYLERRLQAAGCERAKELFSAEAKDTIFDLTRGYPREINVRARQALLNAYLEDAPVVTREHVLGAREFGFEGLSVRQAAVSRAASAIPTQPPSPQPTSPEKLRTIDRPASRVEGPIPSSAPADEPPAETRAPFQTDLFEIEERSQRSWPLVAGVFLVIGGLFAAGYLIWVESPLARRPVPSPVAVDRAAPEAPEATERMTDSPDPVNESPPATEPDRPPQAETETSTGDTATVTPPLPPAGPESTTPLPPADLPEPSPVARDGSGTAGPASSSTARTSETPVRAGWRSEAPAANRAQAIPAVAASPVRHARSLAADRMEQGVALANRQQLDEAVAAFGRAVELDESYAEAHYNLGLALFRQGRVEGAVDAFRKAISIRADDEDAYRHLGIALRNQGQLEEAVAAFHQATNLNPEDALAHHNLGVALRDQGALDEAITELQLAIELDPENAIAQQNLGITLREKGRNDEAIEAFREAIALNPRDALAYHNLGVALLSEKRFDEAIDALRQALTLDPDDPQVHHSLGFGLRSTDKLEEAIASFGRALELDPNYALAHYNLALTLRAANREAEAQREFAEAQRLGYKPPSTSRPPLQQNP